MKEEPMSFIESLSQGWNEGIEFNAQCKKRQEIIASRVIELRKEKKYTQQGLAKIINVNRLTYANYEQCRAEFRIEVLCRIAQVFAVSLDYVCCLTDNRNGRDVTEDPLRYEKIKELEQEIEEIKNTINTLK